MMLVMLMYFLMASTFIIGKAAVALISPVFFIAIRMLLAGSLLLGYVYFFKRSVWRLEKSVFFLLAQLAVFHIYIAYVVEFWALQYVSSAKACLLYNFSPFVTALIVYFLYGEKLNIYKWIGLIIGSIGMVPIMMHTTTGSCFASPYFFFSPADLALLFSVVASAYGWIIMKDLVVIRRYSPLMVNGIVMLGGGLLAMATSWLCQGFWPRFTLAVTHPVTLMGVMLSPFAVTMLMVTFYLGSLIIIANVLGYNLYAYLLHHYSTTFLSFAGSITPLFAALLAWFFLHETITKGFIMTFVMTLIGLWVFYREEMKNR